MKIKGLESYKGVFSTICYTVTDMYLRPSWDSIQPPKCKYNLDKLSKSGKFIKRIKAINKQAEQEHNPIYLLNSKKYPTLSFTFLPVTPL